MTKKTKIEVGEKTPTNTTELLTHIFWKDPAIAPKAKQLLDYIKEWGRSETPYRVSQWETYCTRNNITQSSYHNILRRLKRAGLIEKKYNPAVGDHELCLTTRFSTQLNKYAKIWDEYTVE